MGSPHSSLFANIFLSILVRTVVANLERQSHVLKWLRYADDCIFIAKKVHLSIFLQKLTDGTKISNFKISKNGRKQPYILI